MGRQIGREARAAMNVGNAFSTFWAPVINLARDAKLQFISWSFSFYLFFKPKNLSENQCFFVALFVEEPRWGRNIETPGLGFATFTGFLLEGFRLLEGKGNQSPHWPVERNGIPKPGNVVYMVLLYGCFLI